MEILHNDLGNDGFSLRRVMSQLRPKSPPTSSLPASQFEARTMKVLAWVISTLWMAG